jgi:hypothetical protein
MQGVFINFSGDFDVIAHTPSDLMLLSVLLASGR